MPNQPAAIIQAGIFVLVTLFLFFPSPPIGLADFDAGSLAFRSGDFDHAYKEFEPLAKSGDDRAQYLLGVMNREGKGAANDPKAAASWFHRSALQGNDAAQAALGELYEAGEGVLQDHSKAAHWYDMAAEQRNPVAQYHLGHFHEEGLGNKDKDLVEALMWYYLAATQEQPEARAAIANLMPKLASKQIAEAEEMARNWEPVSPAQQDEMLREAGRLMVSVSREDEPLSGENRWRLLILGAGAAASVYMILGGVWLRFNRMKPAIYHIMAPDALVILLWPLGFYHAHLKRYWAHDRFSIWYPVKGETSGQIPPDDQISVKTWKEALSRALTLASQLNQAVCIIDRAKFDKNLLGEYWNRMYGVEASGQVKISSVFPPRIIKKGMPEKTTHDSIRNQARVSGARELGAIFFGFFYGGALLSGTELGLEHVLHRDDTYLLDEWPTVEAALHVASGGLAGLLASYSARSVVSGIGASVLVSISALAAQTGLFQEPIDFTVWVIAGLALGVGTAAAKLSSRFPTYPEEIEKDIEHRSVFGIAWKHWLWLWLPWQLVVANVLWIAYPISLQLGIKVSTFFLIKEILKAPAFIGLLAWGSYKALESIRMDSEFTRLQSCLRFVAWFLLFPIAVNLLRLF